MSPVCIRTSSDAGATTDVVRSTGLTPSHQQRLRQLYDTRQGNSYSLPAAAPPQPPLPPPPPAYPSMPTLAHYFSTPSSILSPKGSRGFETACSAGPSGWTAGAAAAAGGGGAVAPPPPVFEEMSSVVLSSLPFADQVGDCDGECSG